MSLTIASIAAKRNRLNTTSSLPPTPFLDMEPISRTFLIRDPVLSNTPISIHTLIYNTNPSTPLSRPAKAAPAIVFLHYWGGSASTCHRIPPLLQALCQRQHSTPPVILSLSFRGWGTSSPATPDTALAYSIEALASDTIAVLSQAQTEHLIPLAPEGSGEFVLCGHSMGAKVALQVAALLTDPHTASLTGLRLRGLLLLAPAPPGPLLVSDEARAQMEHAYDSAESVRVTVRRTLAGDAGMRLESDGGMETIVRDSLSGSDGAKSGWLTVGMGEDIRRLLAVDGRMANARLKVSVLVARGDCVEPADRVKAETLNVLKQIGGLDVACRVLEPAAKPGGGDYGHLLPLEAPRDVAQELLALLDDIA